MNLSQLVNLDQVQPSVQIAQSPIEYTQGGVSGGQVQVGDPGVILTSYAPVDEKAAMFFALSEVARGVQQGLNNFDQIAGGIEKRKIQDAETEFERISGDEGLLPEQKEEKMNAYLKDVSTPYLGNSWRKNLANQMQRNWKSTQAQSQFYTLKYQEHIANWRKLNPITALTPELEAMLFTTFFDNYPLAKNNPTLVDAWGRTNDAVSQNLLKIDLDDWSSATERFFKKVDQQELALYITDVMGTERTNQFRADNLQFIDLIDKARDNPNMSAEDVYALAMGKFDSYLAERVNKDPKLRENPGIVNQYRAVGEAVLRRQIEPLIATLPQANVFITEQRAGSSITGTIATGTPEQIKDSLYTNFYNAPFKVKDTLFKVLPEALKSSYDRTNPSVTVNRSGQQVNVNWNMLTVPEKMNVIQQDLNSVVEDMQLSRDTTEIKRWWYEDDKGNRYYDEAPPGVKITRQGQAKEIQRIKRKDSLPVFVDEAKSAFTMGGYKLFAQEQASSLTNEFKELKDMASVSSGLPSFEEAKTKSVDALKRATGLTDDEVYEIMPWLKDYDESTTGITPQVVANQISQSKPISDLLQKKNVDPGLVQIFVAGLSDLLTTGKKSGGSFSSEKRKFASQEEAAKDILADPNTAYPYLVASKNGQLSGPALEDFRLVGEAFSIINGTMQQTAYVDYERRYADSTPEYTTLLTKSLSGSPMSPAEKQALDQHRYTINQDIAEIYGTPLQNLRWEVQSNTVDEGGFGTKLSFDNANQVQWVNPKSKRITPEGRRAGLYFTAEASYRANNPGLEGNDKYFGQLKTNIKLIAQQGIEGVDPSIAYSTLHALRGLERKDGTSIFTSGTIDDVFMTNLARAVSVGGIPDSMEQFSERGQVYIRSLDVLADVVASNPQLGKNSIQYSNKSINPAENTLAYINAVISDLSTGTFSLYGLQKSKSPTAEDVVYKPETYVQNFAVALNLPNLETPESSLQDIYHLLFEPVLARSYGSGFAITPNANIDAILPGLTLPWNQTPAHEKLAWYIKQALEYGPQEEFVERFTLVVATRNSQALDSFKTPQEQFGVMQSLVNTEKAFRAGRDVGLPPLVFTTRFMGNETWTQYDPNTLSLSSIPYTSVSYDGIRLTNSSQQWLNAVNNVSDNGIIPSWEEMHEAAKNGLLGDITPERVEEIAQKVFGIEEKARQGLQKNIDPADLFLIGLLGRPIINAGDSGDTYSSIETIVKVLGIQDPFLQNLRYSTQMTEYPQNWSNERKKRFAEIINRKDSSVFELLEFTSDNFFFEESLVDFFHLGKTDLKDRKLSFDSDIDQRYLILRSKDLSTEGSSGGNETFVAKIDFEIPESNVANTDIKKEKAIRFLKTFDWFLRQSSFARENKKKKQQVESDE